MYSPTQIISCHLVVSKYIVNKILVILDNLTVEMSNRPKRKRSETEDDALRTLALERPASPVVNQDDAAVGLFTESQGTETYVFKHSSWSPSS